MSLLLERNHCLSLKVGRRFLCWISLLLGLCDFLDFQTLTVHIYKSCLLGKSVRNFLSSHYAVKSYLTLAQVTLAPSCVAAVCDPSTFKIQSFQISSRLQLLTNCFLYKYYRANVKFTSCNKLVFLLFVSCQISNIEMEEKIGKEKKLKTV